MAGEWLNWSHWSHCSSSCGEGLTIRTRACSEPPFGGIERCPGNATEVQGCKTSDCTGNIFLWKEKKVWFNYTQKDLLSLIDATGSWTPWTEWSQCSASCGSGSRLRTRACSGDSSLCVGEVAEAETCKTTDCQGNIFLLNPPGIVLLIIPATVVTKGEKRKCFIDTKTFYSKLDFLDGVDSVLRLLWVWIQIEDACLHWRQHPVCWRFNRDWSLRDDDWLPRCLL